MESDIIKKIDALVDMAGTSSNIDTLKAELNEIEREIEKLKNELNLLTAGNIEDKYFKASDKQVDENIKVSLEAKIKRQEKSLKDLQNSIDSVILDEENSHNELEQIKKSIASSNEYITILNERIKTIGDSSALSNYKNIIEEENKKLDSLVSSLNAKEKEYEVIFDKLNLVNQAKEEMREKLESDKNKLSETKASLINPSFYIDLDLKKIDDEHIDKIKASLQELDKRRIEILTDPVMIADEAKTMILDDDRTSALSRIKELVTIVKSKPYMDVPSGADLEKTLDEALENATNERDEFASLIDTKDYSGTDNKIIQNRIEYLNEEITTIENMINNLKSEIDRIDNESFNALNSKLNEAINVKTELEECLNAYRNAIAEIGEEQTPKRRAILSSAYEKKQEELANIKKVIENYKKDQEKLIKRAHDIEVNEISCYENEIRNLEDEIKASNKLLITTKTAKDVLSIENDKMKLKELDDNVKAIKHRKKYNTSPSEIFDEIEMYLGTIGIEDDKPEEFSDKDLNYNYDLTDINIPELDLNSEKEVKEEIPSITNEEVINELPTFEKEEVPNQKLKVINVEPLEEPKKEVEENPFIIGDYKDDDFVDVDTLFNNEVA
jgi:chromosome segregation ATPase